MRKFKSGRHRTGTRIPLRPRLCRICNELITQLAHCSSMLNAGLRMPRWLRKLRQRDNERVRGENFPSSPPRFPARKTKTENRRKAKLGNFGVGGGEMVRETLCISSIDPFSDCTHSHATPVKVEWEESERDRKRKAVFPAVKENRGSQHLLKATCSHREGEKTHRDMQIEIIASRGRIIERRVYLQLLPLTLRQHHFHDPRV